MEILATGSIALVAPAGIWAGLGTPALSISATGLLLTFVLGRIGFVSQWLWLAYLWQTAEVLRGVWLPALHVKPVAIGVRQLLVKIVFVVLFIALW